MLYFSPSGLSKHLSQTRKTACIAARDGRPLPPTEPQQPLSDLPEDFDMDAPPITFDGDFYGDYDPSFFEDEPAADALHDTPPISDSDSDEDHHRDLDRWEPEPHHVPPPSETDEPTAGSHVQPLLPSQSDRNAIESNASRKTYAVRYPSPLAGAAISKTNASDCIDANAKYHAGLNPDADGSDNPYYPFASLRDWLVGHWAKMRGPGSTAFSELLAIEEVRTHQSPYHKLESREDRTRSDGECDVDKGVDGVEERSSMSLTFLHLGC